MIEGRPVIGLILARGGSKRLPGKNIRLLGGKPMIAWTVEAGLASETIDRLVLSTDDDAIMAAGRAAGCEVPFRRPEELAGDEATSVDAALHALDVLDLNDGYLVLLQPTSPLRSAGDIDDCVYKCHDAKVPTCVSVSALGFPAKWLVALDDAGRVQLPLFDESRSFYKPNGAVYVVDIAWFRANRQFWIEGVTLACETPVTRAVDVDTEQDFLIAQALLGVIL